MRGAIEVASQRLGAAVAGGRQEAAGRLLAGSTAADHYARAMIGPWLSGMDSRCRGHQRFHPEREGRGLGAGARGLWPAGPALRGTGLPVGLSLTGHVVRSRPEELGITKQRVFSAPTLSSSRAVGRSGRRADPLRPAAEPHPCSPPWKSDHGQCGRPAGSAWWAPVRRRQCEPPAATSERADPWLARPFGRDEPLGLVGGRLGGEITACRRGQDMVTEMRRKRAPMPDDRAVVRHT